MRKNDPQCEMKYCFFFFFFFCFFFFVFFFFFFAGSGGKLSGRRIRVASGERTPMQWTDGKEAGIHTGQTVGCRSVEPHGAQRSERRKDENSIVSVYKKVRPRQQSLHCVEGDSFRLNDNDPNVYSSLRRYKNEAFLVSVEFFGRKQKRNSISRKKVLRRATKPDAGAGRVGSGWKHIDAGNICRFDNRKADRKKTG